MAIWLDTTGRGTLGIGICDRCRRKMSIEDLWPDMNSPGLRVCLEDRDQLDPYRLPARQPERCHRWCQADGRVPALDHPDRVCFHELPAHRCCVMTGRQGKRQVQVVPVNP